MKTLGILCLLAFLYAGNLGAQKKEVLIDISGHEVSKDEFERIYKKNNLSLADESEIKSPKEYINMYTDFKLKVIEAMYLKMDTVPTFVEELAGYRAELAAPYLTDMQFDEAMIRELYGRMCTEINASHILFSVPAGAGRDQEQAALQKALQVRTEIMAGKDFNEAAYLYSQDPSAKSNKGNLGYFSAFQMVTPFENAAFNTPAGNVSEPVRTSFGYHLIKVHDVRDHLGEIKVAHIMKMFPQNQQFDKAALKAEIDLVHKKLLEGEPFEELARRHSDDKRSAAENGEMPWFSASRMIPEFSTPAFKLKNKGDVTLPVETPFGYHIIQKIDHRPVPPFGEVRAEIEERIKKDPDRSSSTRKVFVEKLKKEYNFSEETNNLNLIKDKEIGSTVNENLLLFSIDGKNFDVDELEKYITRENITSGLYADYYTSWVEQEIIDLENARLEDKYPDFRYLIKEYHDGLLFFNIMEEKIWKFAAGDSAGLRNFYDHNKKLFYWEDRFDGMVIKCVDETTREEAEKYFGAGLTAVEVEDLMNENEDKIEITYGAWEKGDNPVVDYYVWSGEVSSAFNPELTFIRGDMLSPSAKTLDEARGLYISGYQDYLEKKWLAELRKKHKIKINKKLLKKVPHV